MKKDLAMSGTALGRDAVRLMSNMEHSSTVSFEFSDLPLQEAVNCFGTVANHLRHPLSRTAGGGGKQDLHLHRFKEFD